MNNKDLFRTLLTVGFILFVASSVVFAAGRSKGYGTLTAINNDGTVTIKENKGQIKVKGKVKGKGKVEDIQGQSNTYLVYQSVLVQRHNGQRISLDKLTPPVSIYFEYEYTSNGFMVVLIKEVPK